MQTYRTIRQTAATGILSEHVLRLRQKQGRLPGFYSGNRFLVDVDALAELLRAEAMEAVVKKEAGEIVTA